MSFWDFLFYGIIIVGAILFVSLTIYRIDWARHRRSIRTSRTKTRRRLSTVEKRGR